MISESNLSISSAMRSSLSRSAIFAAFAPSISLRGASESNDSTVEHSCVRASGQFQSAAYGSPLVAEAATYHPVCSTEDGIIVSTGFGEELHEHIFLYDSVKGELVSALW